MKRNILLIGAGQLGSRHLQALALCTEPCNIFVVDPIRESLNISKSRFEEIAGFEKHNILYQTVINNLVEDHFDIAIVATNSNVRSKVIRELLQSKKVTNFILEKVLFQSVREFEEIGVLLEKSSSMAFVNCPRRMFDFYEELKSSIDMERPIQMEVIGNKWGLACNGIHFIDLFNYLSGDNITSWRNNLQDKYIDSKRSGYVEFVGNLNGSTERGNSLSLTCYNDGALNTSIRISTSDKRIIIEESLGKVWIVEVNDALSVKQIPFSMTYQSQLTNVVVDQLFGTGHCQLTPFNTSSELHIPFIKTLLSHYNKYQNKNTEKCPIT